jgi:hypothetical protein
MEGLPETVERVVQAEEAAMENEEIYYATRKVFALYAGFFHEVANEIGIERVLVLHERVHEQMGVGLALLIFGACHQPFGLDSIQALLLAGNRGIGIESELAEVTPTSALLRNGRCPMLDGYWMGGMDERTARLLCERGACVRLSAAVRELNPRVEHHCKYRSSAEEECLEEITLH